MQEHDEAKTQSSEAPARQARSASSQPLSLPSAIGNRAMARLVQRMEVSDAVEALDTATKPGVMGAQRQVASTMAAFGRDANGFDKVAIEYQKKTEQPLAPKVESVPEPPGFFPTISGEQYPEAK
jgi:hypothetical protein